MESMTNQEICEAPEKMTRLNGGYRCFPLMANEAEGDGPIGLHAKTLAEAMDQVRFSIKAMG